MHFDSPNISTCPVGLIHECELIAQAPERTADIIAHAKRIRTRELLYVREIRGLMTWHPVQTTNVVVLSGVITFALAWIFSEIIAVSHWYADAKAFQVNVGLPYIGSTSLDVGSHIPTSTALATASRFPIYGIREAALLAGGVMFAILLEKLVIAFLHRRESSQLGAYAKELKQELKTLDTWSKGS